MFCLSYYCLCLLFNKIGEEDKTVSAWRKGGWGEGGAMEGGRESEMAQTIYARMNK
jgi:hypothetical protein